MPAIRVPDGDNSYYIALSTDIVDGKIESAKNIGERVYLTDTEKWMVVGSDTVLIDFVAVESNVTLVDSAGNPIASHESSDGDYHLATAMEQNVDADDNNSSIVNLDSGAVFVGSPTSTLGVAGLQWNLKTTQNCDIRIYDGLTTGGKLIWASGALTAKTTNNSLDFFKLPFSTGLTIDVFDAIGDVLVVYE